MSFPHARLGPYEIVGPLGAGGMGEVYRATDTKLKRQVAIKVLPAALTDDAGRLARFQREAEVLASINHPNIAAIYGVEDGDGIKALVLELVEGPTLADQIATGPIPLDEALPIAKQITDAIEAAHEQGIIHRDLKPANIKVRADGTVKVLDFGLARLVQTDSPRSMDVSASPTITTPALITGAGAILGTAAYMSPEQAKGRPADARSDVWGFGCVLFEMLTGTRAFAGDDVAETLAAVLRAEPDWNALPATTPRAIRRVLERCLQKDRRRRLAAIADVRLELEDDTKSADGSPPRRAARAIWAVGGIAVVALVAASAFFFRPKPDAARPAAPLQFTIGAPEHQEFGGPPSGGTGAIAQVAISPDGRHIVFVAGGGSDQFQLWLRPLSTVKAAPIQGTDGASFPFWSPDSRSVGFFANGKLKKVSIAGGPPSVLCDAPSSRGGAWSRDNVILFNPASGGGALQRVSSSGGTPVDVTTIDASVGQATHRWPHFLPDGRHFLYSEVYGTCCPAPKPAVVKLGSLDASEATVTLFEQESAAFYASGHLFFARRESSDANSEVTLMAQPFNPDTRHLSQEAFPVAEHVGFEGSRYVSASVSDDGTLVYGGASPQGQQQMRWFDRAGKLLGAFGDPTPIETLVLSPDERHVAVTMRLGNPPNLDIFQYTIATGNRTKLTVNPGLDRAPAWSPDSRRLAFISERAGAISLRQMSVDGAVDEVLLADPNILGATAWSADGRYIAYTTTGPSGSPDVWVLPLFGDRKPFPIAQTSFQETSATFSPDGRWIAFTSTESGGSAVYIQPFPGPGGKRQISKEAGGHPVWQADGKALFYIVTSGALDGMLMAVPVDAAGGFEEAPQALFRTGAPRFNYIGGHVYQVTKDGKRFLVNGSYQQSSSTALPLTVVVNLLAAVRN